MENQKTDSTSTPEVTNPPVEEQKAQKQNIFKRSLASLSSINLFKSMPPSLDLNKIKEIQERLGVSHNEAIDVYVKLNEAKKQSSFWSSPLFISLCVPITLAIITHALAMQKEIEAKQFDFQKELVLKAVNVPSNSEKIANIELLVYFDLLPILSFETKRKIKAKDLTELNDIINQTNIHPLLSSNDSTPHALTKAITNTENQTPSKETPHKNQAPPMPLPTPPKNQVPPKETLSSIETKAFEQLKEKRIDSAMELFKSADQNYPKTHNNWEIYTLLEKKRRKLLSQSFFQTSPDCNSPECWDDGIYKEIESKYSWGYSTEMINKLKDDPDANPTKKGNTSQ